jgi:hypothetical protein
LLWTNHFSLKFLLDQCLSTILQHQWVSKLLGFNFHVEYKPGATNFIVDVLSRHDTEAFVLACMLSTPSFQLFNELCAKLSSDPTMVVLRQEIQEGAHTWKWAVIDDLVTMGGRIFI